MFYINLLLKLIIFFTNLVNINQAASCDYSFCNFEGECKQHICECIGDQYFTGPKCKTMVDHCNNQPCENGGTCKNFIGQHICERCADGYGGQNCQENLPNLFTNMILHFQHYAYYGKMHQFLIIVETLGQVGFSLELTANNYAISFMEIPSSNSSIKLHKKWRKTNDIQKIFKQLKLKYYKQLPYARGYYHIAKQTFWSEGVLDLSLNVYDTETASRQIFYNNYKLLVVPQPHSQMECVPKVEFSSGIQPSKPLNIDMAKYNYFEAVIKKRCHRNSEISYEWQLLNSIGNKLLHYFGYTQLPRLKVPPYSLWYKHYGEAFLSYRFELHVTETYGNSYAVTKARCFIHLVPKALFCVIVGGGERYISYEQQFFLDGTDSRDFSLSPNVVQDIIYEWFCFSDDDPDNVNCKEFKSTASKIRMENYGSKKFRLGKTYTFNLTIHSKINIHGRDTTIQKITIIESSTLSIKIVCVRNCFRNFFLADRPVHLKVVTTGKYINLGLKSENAKIKWTSTENEELGNGHRLIYTPPDKIIHKTCVNVEHERRIGKACENFTVNDPPNYGSCTIVPEQGVAYETKFNVTCVKYWDFKLPLTYEFITNNNFTLARNTHSNLTNTPLPPTQGIHVDICDELFSCRKVDLKVSVEPLPNATTYLKTHKNLLSRMLSEGDVRSSLILAMTLAENSENVIGAELIVEQIKDFNFQTLINVQQIISIAKVLCKNLSPLDYRKAQIFTKLFSTLKNAFAKVLRDGEIQDLLPWSYEQFVEELLVMANELSKSAEVIPPVDSLESQIVTRNRPLAESYAELSDFDVTALIRINHWLNMSIEFSKCLDLLGLASSAMHSPNEKPLQYDDAPSTSKNYAIDLTINEDDVNINETAFTIKFPKDSLTEIKNTLLTNEIVIQSIEIKEGNNPFWWYPDNHDIKTDFIYFSMYPANRYRKGAQKAIATPFEMILPLKNQSTQPDESKIVKSYFISRLHMPIFKAAIPAHSILMVKFLNASIDLKVLVKCGKPPRSYETEKSSFVVFAKGGRGDGGGGVKVDNKSEEEKRNARKAKVENQTKEQTVPKVHKFMVTNYQNEEKNAYMAVLPKDRTTEITNKDFSFIMEIQQCLTWNFTLNDPQWTANGCQAIIHSDTDNAIKCHCTHLSAYSGKTHPIIPTEDLRDIHMLLDYLQFNWFMFLFYVFILLLCSLLVCYVHYNRSEYQCPVLMTNLNHDQYDLEVFLITGSPRNAGSTANITFEFISTKGQYIITVRQPKCLLQQNSICKFYMSSNYIELPFQLYITNEQQGRYPSWYCKQIIINNWENQQHHIYNIEKWITNETIQFHSDEKKPINVEKWWQKYRYYLSLMYKNWYEFQPFLGPKIYMNLPREMRTYVWILQLLYTICIVSLYYGPTTMETYEEERESFSDVHVYFWDITLLSFYCYIINHFIHILFHFSIYVQLKQY